MGLATFKKGDDPFPLIYDLLPFKSDDSLVTEIKRIVSDELIDVIVVGLPRYLDGNESEMTKKVRNFADGLKKSLPHLEFHFQDETLSSEEAKERMRNSPRYNYKVDESKIDEIAAVILLEDFLSEH